jgi:hypothetical protein
LGWKLSRVGWSPRSAEYLLSCNKHRLQILRKFPQSCVWRSVAELPNLYSIWLTSASSPLATIRGLYSFVLWLLSRRDWSPSEFHKSFMWKLLNCLD